ncbi:MAG: DUF1800 domain-containing protein [Bacteroidia bacterium]|nr:DUF1800 domain-containing protein [Bacteroidia bacterium]
MIAKQQQIQHLYQRAGFGLRPDELAKKEGSSIPKLVEELFRDSEKVSQLGFISDPLKGRSDKEVKDLKLAVLFVKSFQQLQKLNLHWMDKMATDPGQLRERMTFFWHNHFATHVKISWLMQVQNNTLRKHALGNFRKMLHAIAKDPAMLIYLNNQQNTKKAPNENFAREVMELFTLGEGKYTEQDIKESARAFTGWKTNRRGQYEFNRKQHDFGEKTFMGKKGNFSGEEIIDMILDKPECAEFITRKVYQYFVNPIVDEKIVKKLAKEFYKSDYDISTLLLNIFLSDWFYEEKNRGCLIKSPVELIVSYKRLLDIEMRNERFLLQNQRLLGQMLFNPPNVAGWPHATEWIDSSSLMIRMRLPGIIFGMDEFDIEVDPEYESMGVEDNKVWVPKRQKAHANWRPILKHFRNVPTKDLAEAIVNSLILSPKDRIDLKAMRDFADNNDRESLIKTLFIRCMALPEFQSC